MKEHPYYPAKDYAPMADRDVRFHATPSMPTRPKMHLQGMIIGIIVSAPFWVLIGGLIWEALS